MPSTPVVRGIDYNPLFPSEYPTLLSALEVSQGE